MNNVMIVLNYNDYQTVEQFLQQVENYNNVSHIVVVDNCSTDNSWEQLQAMSSRKVSVVAAKQNNGYASGNNYGIRYAEEHFIIDNLIITNPDITVSEDDLMKILEPLEKNYSMSTGLIFNQNIDTKESNLASNFAWRVPSYKDMICNSLLIVYKLRRVLFHNSNYFELGDFYGEPYLDVEAVPGCFFAIKDSTMKQIGYLDESTFLFGEETILGKKMKNESKCVCVVKDAKIYHQNSVSIQKSIKKQRVLDEFRLKSDLVYIRQYLNISKWKQIVYKMIFKFGCFERRTYARLRNKK